MRNALKRFVRFMCCESWEEICRQCIYMMDSREFIKKKKMMDRSYLTVWVHMTLLGPQRILMYSLLFACPFSVPFLPSFGLTKEKKFIFLHFFPRSCSRSLCVYPSAGKALGLILKANYKKAPSKCLLQNFFTFSWTICIAFDIYISCIHTHTRIYYTRNFMRVIWKQIISRRVGVNAIDYLCWVRTKRQSYMLLLGKSTKRVSFK